MATVDVELDRGELLEAIRHDCLTFLAFYIGDKLTLEVPDFHQEIWEELLEYLEEINQPDRLIGVIQKLFAVPRGFSKSTLAKLSVILFMRYSVLRFTLYVSKTSPIATAAMRDIIGWFTSDNEIALYGKPKILKSSETEGLWILEIGVPGHLRQKKIILKAVGQGHQVRGNLIDNQRPDYQVWDDIEDLDTAHTEEAQAKLDEWTLGSLAKSIADVGLIVFMGNMVRSTTLLARLSKDPEWNPTVFGSIVRDRTTGELKSLWEGKFPLQSLLKNYRTYRKLGKGHIWETEMMNLSADRLLTMSLDGAVMVPFMHPEDIECGFLCLDPAFGKESWHDESAITVHVRRKGVALPVLVDHRRGRWSESQLLDTMVELSYYWNLSTWCIEAQAAQRLLMSLFRLLLIDRKINPDVFSMLPLMASKESKGTRIHAFRQAVANKSYGILESQVEVRLLLEEYSPDAEKHDDVCDSAAYGLLAWDNYGDMIESKGMFSVAGALMQSGQAKMTSLGELDVCRF